MEKREFLDTIKACRRWLNMSRFLKLLVFALTVSAGIGILFQAVSFVVPFYYANHYTVVALVLGILTAILLSCFKRITMGQAALVMDGFGFKERIITAFEHLNEEGGILRLQREDAMKQLQMHKDRIKISLMPKRNALLWMVGALALLFVLMALPCEMKERAKQLHEVQQEAKEKEEEIEEVIENLEEIPVEELSPEQLAALQEMIESMQSSITEYQQAGSTEQLAAATEKLEYKYENMSSQLNQLAQSLQNGAQISPVTAQAMQNMANQMQQMSGNQSLASNQGQNGGNQNGSQNQNGGNQNSQNGNGSNQGNQGNGQNSQNGQNSGNQGNQNQNGGNQNGNQNGNQGQNGQGNQGNGQGGQNGQNGNGGNGSGDGGDGNGSNGSGSGGAGGGRGEGSSDTPHDYVSVPNAIADSGNLTGNVQNHDNSDYFKTQNGLSWEGTHVSHEAVIGTYEQNAYEGIAQGQYPTGMEDVIKEYFASFN